MPTSATSLSAVIVTGGKQYSVRPGDRILVDRMPGEPGSEITLDRVLMVADGEDFKVAPAGTEGVTVTARVIGPRRGPKIDVLRYKSKKRVRVHRGARADLTAIEILTVGGKGVEKAEKPARARAKAAEPAAAEAKPARKRTPKAATPEPAAAEPVASEEDESGA